MFNESSSRSSLDSEEKTHHNLMHISASEERTRIRMIELSRCDIDEDYLFRVKQDPIELKLEEGVSEMVEDIPKHVEHIVLGDTDHDILDSRGAIPSKTAADAKVAIQEMAEYSQKWCNGTSRTRSPHYTKDFPLKEEGKTIEEAYYTQFGAPFQGGGYRAIASGFYQRNNANLSYQEQRKSMEDTLSKSMSEWAKIHEENSNLIKEIRASTDAAIRNQGASIKTLEIQIGK
ncbi:hypothetical protein Tco_0631642 [Tanacetum coccineum]